MPIESEIKCIFQTFEGKKVLVIGDVMLDAYWFGKVDRISPEAPVPVVNVQKKEYRLGGAANVALNLKHLGAEPIICSVIGDDDDGLRFMDLLKSEGIHDTGVIISKNRPTTVKTRVLSGKHQLLRVDTEEDGNIISEETQSLLAKIQYLLKSADLVIFEDYDKGVISTNLIAEIVSAANDLNIPIAVDPKKRNFMAYQNVTLFKPNMRELAEGLKLELNTKSPLLEIEEAAQGLARSLHAKYAMITLSEMGVYITGQEPGSGHLIPAHVRDIYDVSGAGDTVISVAALGMLANIPINMVAALANLAGGLVCEKVGVVPIDKEELLSEAIRVFSKP